VKGEWRLSCAIVIDAKYLENTVEEHKPPFVIHIDGQEFKVEQTTLSGAQLKALVHKDSTYQLFEELHGEKPDKQISDNESVTMRNGLHFYTLPPATFGKIWVR
jgi:hypothetical protein